MKRSNWHRVVLCFLNGRNGILFILLLLFSYPSEAQEGGMEEGFAAGYPEGAMVVRNEIYEGTALWGYIDGGADIYHEYGFVKVIVQEFRWENESYKLEIYRMTDPEAAFGIFSVSRYHCAPDNSHSAFHCFTPHHVMAAQGPYYLSLSSDSDSALTLQRSTTLMNVLLQSNEENPMSIPEPFNRFEDRSRIKCIKGPLGIMNGYPQISDLLEDYTGYVLYLSPVETPSGHAVVFRIRFSDPADCDVLQGQLEGMSLQVDKPCYVQIIRQDPVTLLFTDPGTIPLSNLPSFY